jgi:hypothetical protein
MNYNIKIIITISENIHRPVFYLKPRHFGDRILLRLQMEPTQMSTTKRATLRLQTPVTTLVEFIEPIQHKHPIIADISKSWISTHAMLHG